MTGRPIYLDKAHTCEYVAMSESTLEKEVREGRFPKPRLISGRRVAWLVREVDAWAESRPVADLPPPANTGHANRRRSGLTGAQAA